MAVTATVVALGLVREAVDLGTLGGTHDPGRDHCTLQLRGGGEHRPAVDQEDGREVDLAAVVDTETLDLELFTGLDVKDGTLFPVFFQYGSQTGTKLLVPVLTSDWPQFKGLGPAASATK